MIRKSYKITLLLILTFACMNAFAQTEETAVKNTVNQLFDGMRTSDTSMIRAAFSSSAMLQTIIKNKKGEVSVHTEPIDNFIESVGKPHTEIYDEQIAFDVVRIDGDLAIAWTPYKFFIGKKFSHCGVNSFQLVKINGEWKIQYLIDTRRREGCE